MAGSPGARTLTMDLLSHPEWQRLEDALAKLLEFLADLRTPWETRRSDMLGAVREIEESALRLVPLFTAERDLAYPNPRDWTPPFERHPQPDPTHLLAVREWVLSLGTTRDVPVSRQKRLGSALTQILVAKAAVEAYSKRLRHASAPHLVGTLAALWLLVAECWKVRPLLAGDSSHE